MSEENSAETNYPAGSRDDTQADESPSGVSSYATGGGRVTFEPRVAVDLVQVVEDVG